MLLFIIALLVAGGVIAYVGDRLGTYIGKKRLTAWGLRPRHTAMLYTIVSGGLIAVLTLFALIGYDRTVQRALLYGPQLLQEDYQLKRENAAERRLVAQMDRQTLLASQRLLAANRQTADALNESSRVTASLGAAQETLQRSRSELQFRQSQLVAARRNLVSLHGDLHATHAGLAAAQSRLTEAAEAYGQAHQQYARELGTVNRIAQEGAELAQQDKQLAARNAELTQENDSLAIKNQDLLTQTKFLQGAHLLYHRGQEIGRDVIPTDLSVAETRQRLDAFLATLSDRARQDGAKPGDNGLAVRVLASAHGMPVVEEDALAALAASIAGEPDSAAGVVVVALAGYNAFGGEQTPIELQPYDNVLVYPRGAFIAETPIDGTMPENEVLNALGDFLKQQVQPDARRRGIIPRPDPETGEPTVGEPTDDTKTYALVKQIQRIGAHAVVTARAAADTYSSGPLRLDLSAAPAIPVLAPPPAAAPAASAAAGR